MLRKQTHVINKCLGLWKESLVGHVSLDPRVEMEGLAQKLDSGRIGFESSYLLDFSTSCPPDSLWQTLGWAPPTSEGRKAYDPVQHGLWLEVTEN